MTKKIPVAVKLSDPENNLLNLGPDMGSAQAQRHCEVPNGSISVLKNGQQSRLIYLIRELYRSMLSKPSGPTSKATKNETKNFATVGLSHDLTRTKRDDSKKNSFTLVSCLFGVSRKNDETNYSMKSNELKKSFLSNTKRLSAIPVTSHQPGNRRKEAKRLQTQNTIFFGPRVFSTTKK